MYMIYVSVYVIDKYTFCSGILSDMLKNRLPDVVTEKWSMIFCRPNKM